METTQIKENLLNLMNARSTDYEYVQNPDRTVRKSDGRFSTSDWDHATQTVQNLSTDGIPLDDATNMIADLLVKGSSKIFEIMDSHSKR